MTPPSHKGCYQYRLKVVLLRATLDEMFILFTKLMKSTISEPQPLEDSQDV